MRPITARMAEAKARMLKAHGSGWKRTPKAFYLNADDHAEFMATKPSEVDTTFRLQPRREVGFAGVPVRAGKGISKLYSDAGTCVTVLP